MKLFIDFNTQKNDKKNQKKKRQSLVIFNNVYQENQMLRTIEIRICFLFGMDNADVMGKRD